MRWRGFPAPPPSRSTTTSPPAASTRTTAGPPWRSVPTETAGASTSTARTDFHSQCSIAARLGPAPLTDIERAAAELLTKPPSQPPTFTPAENAAPNEPRPETVPVYAADPGDHEALLTGFFTKHERLTRQPRRDRLAVDRQRPSSGVDRAHRGAGRNPFNAFAATKPTATRDTWTIWGGNHPEQPFWSIRLSAHVPAALLQDVAFELAHGYGRRQHQASHATRGLRSHPQPAAC
ncbi:DUF317 domain-containing protein [Streptomyces sp. NPDC059567]|uniref:DUF317 domain-containing protein n=1 Tax=Streptomyces sp. NPDC059567 TaxID=3346867 RepID=UPI00369E2936